MINKPTKNQIIKRKMHPTPSPTKLARILKKNPKTFEKTPNKASSVSWRIQTKRGTTYLPERHRKDRLSQHFLTKGAYFLENVPRSPCLQGSGEVFYAVLSFTGQQYLNDVAFPLATHTINIQLLLLDEQVNQLALADSTNNHVSSFALRQLTGCL